MKRLPSGTHWGCPRGNSPDFGGQTSRPDWLGKGDEAGVSPSHILRHRPASIY